MGRSVPPHNVWMHVNCCDLFSLCFSAVLYNSMIQRKAEETMPLSLMTAPCRPFIMFIKCCESDQYISNAILPGGSCTL